MKNEFNKTNFIQDEILLHEANFQAKKCNSFHFFTISFNNFQIKLIILVALFIILIFNSNNSYAFEPTDISYEYMETLTISNVSDFVTYLKNYISNTTVFFNYNIIYNDTNYYYICSSLTQPYQRNSSNIRFQPIGNNDFWNISDTQSAANRITIAKSSSSSRLNYSYSIYSNTQNYSLSSNKIKFTNFDLVDESDNLIFSKNFDLPQEEGGGDIDMSEVTNAIDTNSNIQVLILFFLISMFVYLIFYTVANAGRRNK